LHGSVPPSATPSNTVIAYEPVWAIGTGLTPTAADVAEAVRPFGSGYVATFADAFTPGATVDVADRDRQTILSLLSPIPVAQDELLRQSDLTPAALHLVLLELELAGRLVRHAGGRVALD